LALPPASSHLFIFIKRIVSSTKGETYCPPTGLFSLADNRSEKTNRKSKAYKYLTNVGFGMGIESNNILRKGA
jgi:hypothetical protein